MRKLTLLLVFGILAACALLTSAPPLRAAYLVQPRGQFPQAELDKHPEILVTDSFEEFKRAARHRIALWIDKNAIQLVEQGWLDAMPQASYPIVVVGYNEPLLAFGYNLRLCCFTGGPIGQDWSGAQSGFSVIERANGEFGAQITMVQGFKQTPTVDDILRISNDLLDGKIKPTARPSANVPSPTPFPIATKTP